MSAKKIVETIGDHVAGGLGGAVVGAAKGFEVGVKEIFSPGPINFSHGIVNAVVEEVVTRATMPVNLALMGSVAGAIKGTIKGAKDLDKHLKEGGNILNMST